MLHRATRCGIVWLMTTTTTAPTVEYGLGRQLRAAREGLGWSLDEAIVQYRIRFPHRKDSRMRIRRIEQGVELDHIDHAFLAALLTLYGIGLSDIPGHVAEGLRATREVLIAFSPCSGGTPPRGSFTLAPAA